jgi:hypothetical protein
MSAADEKFAVPSSSRHENSAQSICQPRIFHCVRRCLSRPWRCVLQIALVLWIVRVPLSTTVLGLLLLGLAPQAQDLFVEFTLKAPIPLLPFLFVSPGLTIYFLLVLIGVWAMPTHYAARMLVDTDERLGDLLAAEKNLKWKKQQQHEQLSDEELRKPLCLEGSAVHVPRLLGELTFVAVLIAIARSYQELPTLDPSEGVTTAAEHALIEMAVLVVLCAIAFFIYVRNRPKSADLPILRWLVDLNKKMACFWRAVSPGRSHDAEDEASRDIGRFILFLLFIVFLGIFCVGADFAGRWFPRAIAVPFILGGWLPFLSYLSGFGRQWRAPLVIGAYALSATLALVLGDNHSVRLIDADKMAGVHVDLTPKPLQEEVKLWMQVNGCLPANVDETGANKTQPAPCPRPIIFAAAGGASRAGFFMASVIGYFLQPEEAAKHGLDVEQVRKRIFAISSVSGGSMGAVMVTAALNAAKTDAKALPCIHDRVDQWWGETVNYWRDCFEALTSGDFLTGDFFGFAFNDMLPFALRDRAAVLEDSWRDRYLRVVTNPDKSLALPSCQGLECPFLSLTPQPNHWIPLLVLNGTSEVTGSRIVTTPLASTYGPDTKTADGKPFTCPTVVGPSGCQLFAEAVRFHDLLNADVKASQWFGWFGVFERYLLGRSTNNDIRLSTAAHNSARFPLISPPGSVRNHERMVVDRIVDGGYFENYGALSAKELALAIRAIQPDLDPLVIVISNDPNDALNPDDDAISGQPSPPRPQANGGELVTDITAPVTTFANARTAHGILAVDELRSRLHAAIPECKMVIQVRVWPDNGKDLSMSWWESSLVQRQLHQQTEDDKVRSQLKQTNDSGDQKQNGPHLEAIWRQMKATSGCAAAE